MLRSIAAALALVLASCASVAEDRVSSALMEAGLSRAMSECMAERMVDRLSLRQLNDLRRLAGLREEARDMPITEFLDRARSIVDAETYAVVTRAGLACAVGV